MRKSLFTIVLISGLIIGVIPGTCLGENLVLNGGFEKLGEGTAPQGWKINKSRDTKAEIILDDSMPHSGKYAYKIEIAPPGGRVVLYPEENAVKKPRPGQSYLLSIWINTRNLDYNQFFVAPAIRLNFKPTRIRPVPTLDLMAYLQNASGWTELTLQVQAPRGAEEVYLDVVLTKGTVWIDDISLIPLEK